MYIFITIIILRTKKKEVQTVFNERTIRGVCESHAHLSRRVPIKCTGGVITL